MPSDPLLTQAREHHREVARDLKSAARHRERRDELIRRVRTADPGTWTYVRLAAAVGCSKELVAAIMKGRT